MTRPRSTSPPPPRSPRGRPARVAVVAGTTAAVVLVTAVQAFAHAEFTSDAGSTSTNPYPAGSSQTIAMFMPHERGFSTLHLEKVNSTVDVKVTVPTGWATSESTCGSVLQSDGTTVVPSWVCAVETATDGHKVIHWSGPQYAGGTSSSTDGPKLAQNFPFTVTVPSPTELTGYGNSGGSEGFHVVQTYASGHTSIWNAPNETPGTPPSPGNQDFAESLPRWVAAAATEPTPTPSTTPEPTPTPETTPTPPPSVTVATQSLAATITNVPAPAESFSITYANTAVAMAAGPATATHYPFLGALNPIQVSDTRSGGPAWSLNGVSVAFTPAVPVAGEGTSAKYLGWNPKLVAAGAGTLLGPAVPSGFDSGNGLSTQRVLANAPAGHAIGNSTVAADLSLKFPIATTPGDYSTTLTLTAI